MTAQINLEPALFWIYVVHFLFILLYIYEYDMNDLFYVLVFCSAGFILLVPSLGKHNTNWYNK